LQISCHKEYDCIEDAEKKNRTQKQQKYTKRKFNKNILRRKQWGKNREKQTLKKVCKPQHCMLITISEYGEKSAGQGNCTLNAVCSWGIQKYMYCTVLFSA